jgi:hypothetical protein
LLIAGFDEKAAIHSYQALMGYHYLGALASSPSLVSGKLYMYRRSASGVNPFNFGNVRSEVRGAGASEYPGIYWSEVQGESPTMPSRLILCSGVPFRE